jgi:hypothetical protein
MYTVAHDREPLRLERGLQKLEDQFLRIRDDAERPHVVMLVCSDNVCSQSQLKGALEFT